MVWQGSSSDRRFQRRLHGHDRDNESSVGKLGVGVEASGRISSTLGRYTLHHDELGLLIQEPRP